MGKRLFYVGCVALVLAQAGAVSADLIAHWKFDNNGNDEVGSLTWTLNGGAGFSTERKQGELLGLALTYVERNRKNVEFADVPVPAGAEARFDWGPEFPGEWRRSLVWGDYPTGIEDVYVLVSGMQKPDGTYTRQVGLFIDDDVEMTPDQARTLAKALLQAADDFERG